MLEKTRLEKILFLDIETVPQAPSFEKLDAKSRELWLNKSKFINKAATDEDELYNRAGIYAEFGKIVCISTGHFIQNGKEKQLNLQSFYGDDEKVLLSEFKELLDTQFFKSDHLLCAHNGKEFDFPYLCRRMLVNRLKLPAILDIAGKKPWDVQHLDTMELWRFGDYKNYTPLALLAHIFGIPSPKEDMDGSQVWKVYWQEKNLKRIAEYCQKDVITIVQLMLAFRNEKPLADEDVVIV
ncbi:MAG: 3'-5' exonuclease [Bacteroidetes bacterium]|jgi:predicted PolB exonuclease-like 3'-5' exonuclease|nr:3'-5' exonuclease [Bacteroidota bacterium]